MTKETNYKDKLEAKFAQTVNYCDCTQTFMPMLLKAIEALEKISRGSHCFEPDEYAEMQLFEIDKMLGEE